jgi:ElaB/YqjD/DUF883 family membrane-anchored ribosome-binding protein
MSTESQKSTPEAAESAHEAVEESSPERATSPGQTAPDAQTRLLRSADKAQQMLGNALRDLRQYVQENPITSLATAFAAGIVFVTLLSGGSHDSVGGRGE